MTTEPPKESQEVPCKACGEMTSVRGRICKHCKLPRTRLSTCVACKQPIPKGASFCNTCKIDQGWRRHISISNTTLALLVAVAGAISNAYTSISNYLDRESNTSISVTTANEESIAVFVSNSGH